ncbi:ulp1 protease family, C-terminal catalytic domain-containing protein [Tanacetum coccineum]
MIEEKISMISAEKIALEDLLKRANAEFQNDKKVIELYKKYRRLFKEFVVLEDFHAYIDDFDNNDNDGGGKNDDLGSDNVGKKKESAAKDVGKKDGVNAVQKGEAHVNEEREDMLEGVTFTQWIEKNIDWVGEDNLFMWPRAVLPITAVCPPQQVVTHSSPKKNSDFFSEIVFQTRFGPDVSSVRVNMETLAPRLWIDANVIDCWVAILNHEEFVKGCPSPRRHFFPTGCITKAIIEGTIDKEHQWKVFSDEISEQFKHDVSSISLSEVDLAFFPIYASGHFYVVVFHLKSPSAMIILDNSDCGETYNSKYKAVCGPLKKFFARHLKKYNHPKHNSVSKLKHRIPKLKWSTTKNNSDCGVFTMMHLEHYFGKPAGQWDFEKMFDLAFKFKTENDEQKRISIVVNAIKNRNERDPSKTE